MEISLNEYQILGPGDRIEAGDVHTAAPNEYARGYTRGYIDTLSIATRWIGAKTSEYPGFRFARKKTEETNMSKFKVGDRVRVVTGIADKEGPQAGEVGTIDRVCGYSGIDVVYVLIPGKESWSVFETTLELLNEWRKLAPTEDAEEGDEARGNGKVFVADDCGYFDGCGYFADSYCMRKLGFEIYRKVKSIDPSNTPPDEQLWGAVWLEDGEWNRTSVARFNEPEHETELDLLATEGRERGCGGAWW